MVLKALYYLSVLCVLLGMPATAQAKPPEELPHLPIIDLVYQSEYVVTARPLSIRYAPLENRLLVEITTVLKGDNTLLRDSLLLHYSDYTWPWGTLIPANATLLLFINGVDSTTVAPYFYLTLSGIRILHDTSIYFPFQHENPGPYTLYPSETTTPAAIRWDSMLVEVKAGIVLMDSLLAIRDKRYEWNNERGEALFDWILHHKSLFKQHQLGFLEWDIFSWIIQDGLYLPAWKAICLYHELVPDEKYIPDGHILHDSNSEYQPPFAGPDALLFLLDIALDTTRSGFEQQQAIRHLSNCKNMESDRYVLSPEVRRVLMNGFIVYMQREPGFGFYGYAAGWCLTTLPGTETLRDSVFVPFLKEYIQGKDDYWIRNVRTFLEEVKK